MKRLFAAFVLFLTFGLFSAEAFIIKHPWNTNIAQATVTVVPGSAIPLSEDNAHPSMSRWSPSCLDATWGVGCNVATQTCIAPTSGTPDEPCQSPQQFVVTGGSGNGTTATINYTSYAGYTFVVGQPFNITGATQIAWNTRTARITTFSNVVGAPCTAGHQCVTIGFATMANAFRTDTPTYVGGMGGNQASYNGNTPFGYGWGTSGAQNQGPNGQWTLAAATTTSASYDINTAFPSGIVGSLGLNGMGYSGTITQPAVVTASSCAGSVCSVSFLNSTSCASSCVSGTTKIVAGQLNDPVIAWDTGPVAPFAVENGTITKCVDAVSLSHGGTISNPLPMQFVAFSVNGGAFVKAITPQADPFGTGAAGTANNTKVYCAKFAASSLGYDGLWEMRAIACPYAGPCGQLTSVITAEATNGSGTLKAAAHNMADNFRFGVTQSQDPAYPIYNWALNSQTAITITGATFNATGCAVSNPCVTYTFNQPATLPVIPAKTFVQISGVITNNSCPVTGGSTTGGALTYTFSNTCSFPVGSQVSVSGVTATQQVITSTGACTYTSGTGDLAIPLPSAVWGAAPQININYTLGATGSTSANGVHALASSASAGTVLHFTVATGLSFTCGTATVTGNAPASYPWNTNVAVASGVFAGGQPPTVTASGSGTATIPGMATSAWSSGGTIQENWNGPCVVQSSASGSITCSVPSGSASTTWASGGTIQPNANLYDVVGGAGDNPTPYDPAWIPIPGSLTGDTFEAQAFLSSNGNSPPGQTGCHLEPCGIIATKNSTLWLTRNDAGTFEEISNANQRAASFMNTGSFWGYSNASGTIQASSAYVDAWNPSAVTTGCSSTHVAAANWNATPPTYAGSYCPTIVKARASFVWNGIAAVTETVGTSGGCTTFTNAANSAMYVGEPVNWQGLDAGAAGDGSNGILANLQLYWVQSVTGTAVTLTTKPGGACIPSTEAAFIVASPKMEADLSFDNVYLKCNTSFGCVSSTNPETVGVSTPDTGQAFASKAGWYNILPDLGNGTGQHDVELIWSNNNGYGNSLGRTAVGVDRSQPVWTATPVNTIGPFPGGFSGLYGAITVTGGSLSGTCPGAGCTETLTYTVLDDGQYASAHFQTPTSSAPGQGLVIQNQVNTGGAGSSDWNCGTPAAPCRVTAASAGSVSFLNPTADGTWSSSSGSVPISPITVEIELAKGTLSATWNGGQPTCANTSTNQSYAIIAGTQACLMGTATTVAYGTTNAFPIIYTQTGLDNSNCLSNSGGFTINFNPKISTITPSNGTTNDLVELATTSAAFPLYTTNQCTVFEFTNGQLQGGGTSDAWEHDSSITGPNYSGLNTTNGIVAHNTLGIVYETNLNHSDAQAGFELSGYAWGNKSFYNLGSCHNDGGIAFHIRCLSGGNQVPAGSPHWGYNGQAPPHVLHSYSSYANYLSNTEITCAGSPCVTSASRVYVLDALGIPKFAGVSWEIYLQCNFYPTALTTGPTNGLGTMSFVLSGNQVTWMDKSNNVIEVAAAPSGTCTPAGPSPSGTVSMNWFPVYHADTNFWSLNFISSPSELTSASAWVFTKDLIEDDIDMSGTGGAEQMLTNGSTFINMAIINSTFQAKQQVTSSWTSLKAIAIQNNPWINDLFINDNLYAFDFYAPDSTYVYSLGVTGETEVTDLFEVNINLANSFPYPGFPYTVTQNPSQAGAQSITPSIWGAEAGQDAIGGGAQNIGIWPSNAWAYNSTTGVVTTPGQPSYNSLLSCPWYCAANDTGTGLY